MCIRDRGYTLPTAEVNKSLAFYMDESGGDMEATAKNFLQGSSSWTKWFLQTLQKKLKLRFNFKTNIKTKSPRGLLAFLGKH